MRVCAENMTRKLQVGDYIKCKGIRVEIGEILSQDFYKDEYIQVNSNIEGMSDRSYIDIEFKDTYGKYRHWKSNIDGGSFEYRSEEVKPSAKDTFTKLFKEEGMTLEETWNLMYRQHYSATDIMIAVLAVIGNCTWKDD